MSTKIWVAKHRAMTTPAADDAEFFVEAKINNKWKRVGGPFADQGTANDFAQTFSVENPTVEVQVVVEQG